MLSLRIKQTWLLSLILTIAQQSLAGVLSCEGLLSAEKVEAGFHSMPQSENSFRIENHYPISLRPLTAEPLTVEQITALAAGSFGGLHGKKLEIEAPGLHAKNVILIQIPSEYLKRFVTTQWGILHQEFALLVPVTKNFRDEVKLMESLVKGSQLPTDSLDVTVEKRGGWLGDFVVRQGPRYSQIGKIANGKDIVSQFPGGHFGAVSEKERYFLFSIPDLEHVSRLLTGLASEGVVRSLEPIPQETFVQSSSKESFVALTEAQTVFSFETQGQLVPISFDRDPQFNMNHLSAEMRFNSYTQARQGFLEIVKRYSIAHGRKFDPATSVLTEIDPHGTLNLYMGDPVLGKKHFSAKAFAPSSHSNEVILKIETPGLGPGREVEYDLVEAVFGSGTPVEYSKTLTKQAAGKPQLNSSNSKEIQETLEIVLQDWTVRNLTAGQILRKLQNLDGLPDSMESVAVISANELAFYRLILSEGLSRVRRGATGRADEDFLLTLNNLSSVFPEDSSSRVALMTKLNAFIGEQNAFFFRGRTWLVSESIRQWQPAFGVKQHPGKPFSALNKIDSNRYQSHLYQNVWIEVLDSQNKKIGWVSGNVIGFIDSSTGHYPIIRTSEGTAAIKGISNSKGFQLGDLYH